MTPLGENFSPLQNLDSSIVEFEKVLQQQGKSVDVVSQAALKVIDCLGQCGTPRSDLRKIFSAIGPGGLQKKADLEKAIQELKTTFIAVRKDLFLQQGRATREVEVEVPEGALFASDVPHKLEEIIATTSDKNDIIPFIRTIATQWKMRALSQSNKTLEEVGDKLFDQLVKLMTEISYLNPHEKVINTLQQSIAETCKKINQKVEKQRDPHVIKTCKIFKKSVETLEKFLHDLDKGKATTKSQGLIQFPTQDAMHLQELLFGIANGLNRMGVKGFQRDMVNKMYEFLVTVNNAKAEKPKYTSLPIETIDHFLDDCKEAIARAENVLKLMHYY